MADGTLTRTVVVNNPQGMHARPAEVFVKMAMQYQAKIEVIAGANLPVLVKLASARRRPIAEAAQVAQDAGRKYIAVASSILGKPK